MTDNKQSDTSIDEVVVQQNHGGVRFDVDSPHSVQSSKGVLGTARAAHGGPLTREPQDSDIVAVNGMEMRLAQAALHGFVTKTEDGSFRDLDANETAAFEKAEQDQKEAEAATDDALVEQHGISVSEEAEAAVVGISQDLESMGLNPTALIGSLAARPDAVPGEIKMLAREAGVPEDVVMDRVRLAARGAAEGVSEYLIAEVNLSPEQTQDFWHWAEENRRADLPKAFISALYLSDARPFIPLVKAFQTAHGMGVGAAAPSEVQTVPGSDASKPHREVVNVPGVGRTTREAARKLQIF